MQRIEHNGSVPDEIDLTRNSWVLIFPISNPDEWLWLIPGFDQLNDIIQDPSKISLLEQLLTEAEGRAAEDILFYLQPHPGTKYTGLPYIEMRSPDQIPDEVIQAYQEHLLEPLVTQVAQITQEKGQDADLYETSKFITRLQEQIKRRTTA